MIYVKNISSKPVTTRNQLNPFPKYAFLALEQYEEFLFSELMSVVETREFSVLLLCFPEPDEKFLAFGLLPSKLPFIFFPSLQQLKHLASS